MRAPPQKDVVSLSRVECVWTYGFFSMMTTTWSVPYFATTAADKTGVSVAVRTITDPVLRSTSVDQRPALAPSGLSAHSMRSSFARSTARRLLVVDVFLTLSFLAHGAAEAMAELRLAADSLAPAAAASWAAAASSPLASTSEGLTVTGSDAVLEPAAVGEGTFPSCGVSHF